jgi:hypothetical protein
LGRAAAGFRQPGLILGDGAIGIRLAIFDLPLRKRLSKTCAQDQEQQRGKGGTHREGFRPVVMPILPLTRVNIKHSTGTTPSPNYARTKKEANELKALHPTPADLILRG